jgi:hypothetical protein
MAAGVACRYVDVVPPSGLAIVYATRLPAQAAGHLCVRHSPEAWQSLSVDVAAESWSAEIESALRMARLGSAPEATIEFDLIARAFFFLSSIDERRPGPVAAPRRAAFGDSVFAREGVPQDIVDQYLELLIAHLHRAAARVGMRLPQAPRWPGGKKFAIVLSHDVDFLPERPIVDTALQGARTFLRHLVKQRDPASALRAAGGFARAVVAGRDPYGCVPEMIAKERALGVRASYQVAVAHRHPSDVNYRVENRRTAKYLEILCGPDADLCLHGSVRSTENPDWYLEEVETLARHLARPLGSRQHYLSFDYDALFSAQEQAGIRYDMSLGYPDQIGARAGFSYPFFPYNLREDRPYDVLQISLFLMDVTLQSYLGLRSDRARAVAAECVDGVERRGGCVSIVWHPIVFGGARDPGYDALYWDLVERVIATDGLATDGRTIDAWWRGRAAVYPSFRSSARAALPDTLFPEAPVCEGGRVA